MSSQHTDLETSRIPAIMPSLPPTNLRLKLDFELDTRRRPTFSELYLIHQQGWQGAAEHVSQPDRIAWKSMCATEEGRQKGENWCKRAIWQNTLPTAKHIWKSVDKLTSGAFVDMWREQVDRLYTRFSEASSVESGD
jgi:hypothetical protein